MLQRGYGCIMHDIARKYKAINISDLHKLEKLHITENKPQLDINVLINFKTFGVLQNLYMFTFRILMSMTLLCLKEKLRNNAIHKRIRKRNETTIRSKLNTIDRLTTKKSLSRNIKKSEQSSTATH